MGRPAAITDPDWAENAIDVIERLARKHGTVTSEDLRREYEAPEHGNQVGAAFRTARARKIITAKTWRPSRDKSRRGGAITVWELHPRLKEQANDQD